jgi:hypothetical protein
MFLVKDNSSGEIDCKSLCIAPFMRTFSSTKRILRLEYRFNFMLI